MAVLQNARECYRDRPAAATEMNAIVLRHRMGFQRVTLSPVKLQKGLGWQRTDGPLGQVNNFRNFTNQLALTSCGLLGNQKTGRDPLNLLPSRVRLGLRVHLSQMSPWVRSYLVQEPQNAIFMY